MILKGYTVLRNLPTAGLCDDAVADYLDFCQAVGAEQRHAKARINTCTCTRPPPACSD